jgi:hypothetical protein
MYVCVYVYVCVMYVWLGLSIAYLYLRVTVWFPAGGELRTATGSGVQSRDAVT